MAKIKITDLPKDTKVSSDEIKSVVGGAVLPLPDRSSLMIGIWPTPERVLRPYKRGSVYIGTVPLPE